MSQSDLEFNRHLSSSHSTEDSVENIIRKYTNKHGNYPSFDTYSPWNNRSYVVLNTNDHVTFSKQLSGGSISKKIKRFDSQLYNFITSYCQEEIRKEVDLKISKYSKKPALFGQRDKKLIDKATYCRPLFNLYNQEFIFKTLERNVKLTRLIRKLVTAHQREKENEAWNNFINTLKNKHSHSTNESAYICNKTSLDDVSNWVYDSEFIEDCYNTKFSCRQSTRCKDLLRDIYGNQNETHNGFNKSKKVDELTNKRVRENHTAFKKYPLCYPTSSQGRLSVLKREKERIARTRELENKLRRKTKRPLSKSYRSEENVDNAESQLSKNKFINLKNMLIQTEYNAQPIDKSNKDCAVEVKLEKEGTNCTTKSIIQLERNTQTIEPRLENDPKKTSLIDIENKLEALIDSINSLIVDFKIKKRTKIDSQKDINKIFDWDKSVLVEKRLEDPVYHDTYEKYSNSECILFKNKLDLCFERYNKENADLKKLSEIFSRELGDNESSNKTCAVQITLEVPTRERSTEVTKSLSRAGNTLHSVSPTKIEEIVIPATEENGRLTIAVNTDPLSILTLLRISTQAMKRLFSYVPNFDYFYYLSRLQFPQLPSSIENKFVCNICGADFKKASELSDHIQDHDLGNAASCCVCRHVLDVSRRPVNIYSCRYCGQCFARAYCCQLHQETCARRLGKEHEVANSNLLILR